MTGGGARPRSSIDCCPLLAPEPERLTAADGVGQGSVIPSHDPSRISRLRPVWRKLASLRGNLSVAMTKRARGSAAWGPEVLIMPLDGLGSSIAFAPTVAASSTSSEL